MLNMTKKFKDAIKSRRTFYQIDNKSTLSEKELLDLIRFAVEYVPSAFNSQTTRVVLLTGEAHQKLWNIVKNTLRKRISAEAFAKTEQKIDGSFSCGYGTILYFEDMSVVHAMHQFVIWTMLEDARMGASLQHYNPLVDDEVRAAWNLPLHWKLIAQMPFGVPVTRPGSKEVMPLDERVFAFND